MMPDSHVDAIKSKGFVRVLIRPLARPESLTIAAARKLVTDSVVSLRGWDYPHLAWQVDENGGSDTGANYAQDWCNWHRHVEFWRMFKSGQFLHYKALREDLDNDSRVPSDRVLAVGSFMFTVTEVAEFAHRLATKGIYSEGATISLMLGNAKGRRLWVEDPRRIDFLHPLRTSAEEIVVERAVTVADLRLGDPKEIAAPMISEVFDAFGWNPSAENIRSTQEELYGNRIGRDR